MRLRDHYQKERIIKYIFNKVALNSLMTIDKILRSYLL